MTPLFPARRRAERFDSLVEGGRRDDVDRTTSDLLELVSTLRSVPEPQARPEFVADLRERLLLAAAAELTPVRAAAREREDVARLTIKPSRTRRERRVGIALGAVAILGASTSMAVASQGAIPGDALYPVKRAIENTQAGFSVGDDSKGETVLGNASTRLDEVGKLAQEKSPDAELVTHTINDFTEQFTDGSNSLLDDYETNGNQGSIGQIHSNAEDSMVALSGLDDLIPSGGGATTDGWSAAHEALLTAAQTVFSIDAQAVNLCPDCGSGLLEVPPQLVAGATQTLTDAGNNVAGGELTGTDVPGADPTGASQPQSDTGGKDNGGPSGMNPPETPIEIPTQVATEPSDTTTDLGGLVPTGGLLPTGGDNTSTGGGGNGGGHGGKGGKDGKQPVDLTPVTAPVTDTVNQVVTGVVAGVNGLLNGLAGK
jgi:hypothetical protein